MMNLSKLRSSRPEVFCKKGALRNFAKFTEKHLCRSLVFNKIAGLRPATLLKRGFHISVIYKILSHNTPSHFWHNEAYVHKFY